MAKPKIEPGQMSPPYMEWSQWGHPMLYANVQRGLTTGKRLRVSLSTDDSELAKRVMRVLIAQLVIDGRLAPESGAARVYGRGSAAAAARAKEIVQLQTLSQSEYDTQVPLMAQRWDVPKQIIHLMAQRRPTLSLSVFSGRRMRRRKRGEQIPKATSWHYRSPGGKHFHPHRKRINAQLRLEHTHYSWLLPTRDHAKAAEIMEPVRVARERVHQAAVRTLNYAVGSVEHADAVRNREKACVALAAAIIEAGGPIELAKFVQVPPPGEGGMALPKAVKTKATKSASLEKCVEWVCELIRANPGRPPVPLAQLRKKAKSKFGVTRRQFEEGNNCCVRQSQRLMKNFNWTKGGRPPG